MDLANKPVQIEEGSLLNAIKTTMTKTKPSAALKIDYPLQNSLFPPDMVAPTFLFHDSAKESKTWFVDISITGETGHIYVLTDGRKPKDEIDQRCESAQHTYQEPVFLKTAKGWTANVDLWKRLTRLPEKEIKVTIYGLAASGWNNPVVEISLLSMGTVTLSISRDPVGAPIFYRDVPLIPTTNQSGVIMPVAEEFMPLIEWRLRNLSKPRSTVLLSNMPNCTNCHTFSQDGKFLGMDMDSPTLDKGAYTIVPVRKQMAIRKELTFTWNSYYPEKVTYGLFASMSPNGRYVASAINENIYVTNYLDVRFIQTFYPTRGHLAFYDRKTEKVSPLPGADNPEFVHTNPVWSPDGRQLVFLRAKATDIIPPEQPPLRANDPNEFQIKYDLYTIPFNKGLGGEARPLPGASENGKSNSFPKISPDGRWIVWVQANNGLLMRPDSKLYIMPLSGGTPRLMTCNMSLMNSWHSWSPNSRWLVFSSKANTPYTQMFLSHIDDEGNDSPAILVPNSTAANRAVNIPEFINIKPDGIVSFDTSSLDYVRHFKRGLVFLRSNKLDEAYQELQAAFKMKPDFYETLSALGFYYFQTEDIELAVEYFEKALSLNPQHYNTHVNYGIMLINLDKFEEALVHFQEALKIDPINPEVLTNTGTVEYARGNLEKAKDYFERAIQVSPRFAMPHFNLAVIKEEEGKLRDALDQFEKCLELVPEDVGTLDKLSWLYATILEEDLRNGQRALELALRLESLSESATPRL